MAEGLSINITCQKCKYNWDYEGKDGKLLPRATCPSCGNKTPTGV